MAVLCVAVEVSIIHWPLTHIPWWRWLYLCNNVGVGGGEGGEGKEGVHLNEKKGEKEERRFVRLAKQDIVTHAAVAEREGKGREGAMLEGGGGGGGEKRRGGGPRHSGGREIHYHDNGFSDWLTCRCWPAMPAACLPDWQGREEGD